MIRGFVAGVLWGGLVAGAGLGVASVMSPMKGAAVSPEAVAEAKSTDPAGAAPESQTAAKDDGAADPASEGAPEAKATTEAVTETATGTTASTTSDPATPESKTPEASADTPKTETGAAAEPAQPAAPEAKPGDATTQEVAEAKGDAPTAAPAAEAPAGAADEAGALPEGHSQMSPATEPLVPAQEAPSLAPAAETADGDATAVKSADAALPGSEAPGPSLPEATPAPASESGEPQPTGDAAPMPAPEPAQEPAPEPAPDAGKTEPEVLLVPEPEAETPAPTTITPDPVPETAQEATLAPDGKLDDKVAGVTVGRLPSIGKEEAAPDEAAPSPADGAAPAVRRFAVPFENPTGKPLFAILLIDPGTPDLDRAQLAALGFPVTFVIDPLSPTATAAMQTYRAGGKEVVMLATGIPAGAKASDLEQTFSAYETALPEAVGLLDAASAGFQDDRGLAADVVGLVKAQGRGVITYDRGLNAADQVARREDVPAALVFRSLDDDGEDTPLIRRYLDRAAFKAAQEGKVAVVGTARPETVAALLEWTVEGRASSVALAPASAVMTVE